MSDRIQFAVSATPIETIASENTPTGDTDIIASEIGQSMGAGGDSVNLANYSGVVANQGFKDGAVGYKDTSVADGVVPTALTATDDPDFVYIENTGFKYSSPTVLGAITTDCIMVAISEQAWATGTYGGHCLSTDSGQIHYYGIAWLKPGQGIVLPYSANIITKMGANAGDFSNLGMAGTSSSNARLCVKTFTSAGAEATDGNAIKFLVVT